VKCVVVNPVKKSFDPVVSANFVTSVLPKTTTTVAVQVDKALKYKYGVQLATKA